ncbi:hypothetical protein EHS25_006516 [Saitozyma podzolica]|uniref:Uncharacterized protein n=1 Tax=Saitozyma podzolica TaxID=1890683 RepID=A0A427YS72_9TREE|nr:hypothetical protein EHS25_006516 [Saitozyma podzolica]
MLDTTTIPWQLIRGSAPSGEYDSGLGSRVAKVLEADYAGVVSSDEGKRVLSDPQLWEGLIPSGSQVGFSENQRQDDEDARLVVAVALLLAFVQANWTGPELSFAPSSLVPSPSPPTDDDLNAAALPLLTLGGEPAYHLATHPTLLLLARRTFTSLAASPTTAWWLLRLHLVHTSLLDEPVPLDSETIQSVSSLRDQIPPEDQDTLAKLHLELGLLHHRLGQDKQANQEFLAAARASGLEFELTGALGKKTKYQVAALSQLVLLAESRSRPDDTESTSTPQEDTGTGASTSALPETLALNDDTLLENTEFTKVSSPAVDPSSSRLAHLDPGDQPPLHPLDQSLLISLCLSQHNDSPSSGLTASQMMPFLARVITHPRNWSVHTTALLLRSRLEASRSRTVERATLQLAALIEQMPTSDSAPKERVRFFHQLPLPSRWEMERELAKRYLTVGVSRSALEIFSRLEMWEDAVVCLQRMDREDEAENIVRDLLQGKKIESDLIPALNRADLSESRREKLNSAREAKLWCLLGDLALNNDAASRDPQAARKAAVEHYTKAWEVSNHTSSRAMRSLGSLHFSKGEYTEAIECLKAALEINPQYARVWFTLGVCYVRLERWNEAKDAFRREVGVDEEDGEGWNNLAAVYLRLGEENVAEGETASVTFENKLLAHRALRQGLRYAFNNWRMWQNYTVVSIDVGELAEAARAFTRVVEELASRNPSAAVDADVLDKLVDAVTRDDWSQRDIVVPKTSNEGFGLLPIVERLFDVTILPRISDDPRVWRAHARLMRWKEDWSAAVEDYLRAYRCGTSSDARVERELERWKEAVQEIEDLVDVLSLLGPKAAAQASDADADATGKKKGDWRFQARGIVRTFMGRTKESFEDQPEWSRLQDMLDDLKRSE